MIVAESIENTQVYSDILSIDFDLEWNIKYLWRDLLWNPRSNPYELSGSTLALLIK